MPMTGRIVGHFIDFPFVDIERDLVARYLYIDKIRRTTPGNQGTQDVVFQEYIRGVLYRVVPALADMNIIRSITCIAKTETTGASWQGAYLRLKHEICHSVCAIETGVIVIVCLNMVAIRRELAASWI